MMLPTGLSYIVFIIIKNISIPSFSRAFNMKRCWICQRLFLHLLRWCDFCLILLMCCIILIDLHILNHPFIPGMKPTWSWCMIFVIHYWFRFASISLGIFTTIFIKEIGL
jgi:hypothetical protein